MFKWKDLYTCNIEEIDNQHKRLFQIADLVYDLSIKRNEIDKYDEIIDVIEELKNYTIEHFKYEEALLLQYGYFDYDTHKIEHDFFIKKLQRFERKDIEGAQSEAIIEMISFITDWIAGHILKTDKCYWEFLKSKGLK